MGVWTVAYTPHHDHCLASGSLDDIIRLWDVRSQYSPQQPAQQLNGHSGMISSLCFSPINEHLLASASDDHTVRLWDVRTGQALHTVTGHTHAVFNAVFHPKGHALISTSFDKSIRVWETASGRQQQQLDLEELSYSLAVTTVLALAPRFEVQLMLLEW